MKSALQLIIGLTIGSILAIAAAPATAQPATELQILATDPGLDALLARQQPFFVRFKAQSAAPLNVSISGWFKGQPVLDNGGTGAPALLPASGVGVVSFFYWGEKPTKIDEVRLHLTDARSGAAITDYAFPVTLTWLADDPPSRQPPAWVTEWRQAQNPQAVPAAASAPLATTWWIAAGSGALLAAGIAGWGWRRRRSRAAGQDDSRPR
ncbi:MAG: hypothetical protein JWN94_4678 [Betaproteobacteria bacterium]|nr:hypothetical protein [Betaproteobacteria bacterium]